MIIFSLFLTKFEHHFIKSTSRSSICVTDVAACSLPRAAMPHPSQVPVFLLRASCCLPQSSLVRGSSYTDTSPKPKHPPFPHQVPAPDAVESQDAPLTPTG